MAWQTNNMHQDNIGALVCCGLDESPSPFQSARKHLTIFLLKLEFHRKLGGKLSILEPVSFGAPARLKFFGTANPSPGFQPFFDRIPVSARILVALFLGFLFFCLHYAALGDELLNHYGWFLAVLISSAPLFLIYATATFRAALSEMESKTEASRPLEYAQGVQQKLSDRSFVRSGLLFGVLNSLMGVVFRIPDTYRRVDAVVTTYVGFFLVGFLCGMAAQGIYGIINVVDVFVQEKTLKLDYTDPDGCGGLRFLGAALVRFSSVTLFMGVLIAWYVLHVRWHPHSIFLMKSLLGFWVAFPFLLSFLVLFVPGAAIRRRLQTFKLAKSKVLQERIEKLRDEIDQMSHSSHQQEGLQKAYDFNVRLRSELYKMAEWPYDINSGIKYSLVLAVNAGAAVVNADDQWHFVGKVWRILGLHTG